MDGDINLNDVPLTSLTTESRLVLSLLFNTTKVLPTDGPDKLPRDWRGLASLVNISSEVARGISNCEDRAGKVLEIWSRSGNGANVGELLQHLQRLDRYDVHDDLIDLARAGKLVESRPAQLNCCQVVADSLPEDLITVDDVRCGSPQMYHAYVLFADEDKDFVDELLRRMRAEGFKLCTQYELMPGYWTEYAPVSRLISERCHRIILIYSPDFLKSPANSFYMDYAQAVGIKARMPKIIPCLYRPCTLPTHLQFIHKLYYSPPGHKAAYDFWERLSNTLIMSDLPRVISANSTNSMLKIANSSNGLSPSAGTQNMLCLPSVPTKSISLNGLDSLQIMPEDSASLSGVSNVSLEAKKKKSGPIRKLIDSLKGKKHKKAIMVQN